MKAANSEGENFSQSPRPYLLLPHATEPGEYKHVVLGLAGKRRAKLRMCDASLSLRSVLPDCCCRAVRWCRPAPAERRVVRLHQSRSQTPTSSWTRPGRHYLRFWTPTRCSSSRTARNSPRCMATKYSSGMRPTAVHPARSEEHTSELQSRFDLV